VVVPSGASLDAWAVGFNRASGGEDRGFILHEHGGQWTKVYPLGLAPWESAPILTGLAMASPSDGWAVGVGGPWGALLHLVRGTWTRVPVPVRVASMVKVTAVNAVALSASGREGWAVGQGGPAGGMLLHLAGGIWSSAPVPTDTLMLQVALSASGSEGWAV